MSATYEPGTVAVATIAGVPAVPVFRTDDSARPWVTAACEHRRADEVTDVRPLVVLDPEDRADAKRIVTRLVSETRLVLPGAASEWDAGVQAALRALVTPPKPYREHSKALPPWPEVGECHSGHVEGHECPQCAWEHEHDWVAWTHPDAIEYGVPIRCSKCGGRKCDRDDCAEQRHTHTHAGGAS